MEKCINYSIEFDWHSSLFDSDYGIFHYLREQATFNEGPKHKRINLNQEIWLVCFCLIFFTYTITINCFIFLCSYIFCALRFLWRVKKCRSSNGESSMVCINWTLVLRAIMWHNEKTKVNQYLIFTDIWCFPTSLANFNVVSRSCRRTKRWEIPLLLC